VASQVFRTFLSEGYLATSRQLQTLINVELYYRVIYVIPIPVTERPKTWDSDRSLAGIVGSNPTGGMDICPL